MIVLQVMSCIEYGGTEAFVYNHCRKLISDYGCKVVLLICGEHINPERKKDFEQLGIKIYKSKVPSIRNYRKIYKDIKKIKEAEHIDVIHSHMNLGSFVVMHCAYKLGIRQRIAHSHDTAGYSSNKIRRTEQIFRRNRMIHDATWLAACSADAGKYLFGNAFETGKAQVIPNGIDPDTYQEYNLEAISNLKHQYGLDGKYIIGNITRFDEKKNQKFLVKIFSEIVKKEENMVLVLGGVDAGKEAEIKTLVKELKIDDKVRFVGVRKDMPIWMQTMDLWVMPSLFEGFGIALVEAQFCGLQCIVSDQVSRESDLQYGLMEYLPLDDKESWIQRIQYAYENKKLINKVELQKKNKASSYNIKNSAKQLYEMYKSNGE